MTVVNPAMNRHANLLAILFVFMFPPPVSFGLASPAVPPMRGGVPIWPREMQRRRTAPDFAHASLRGMLRNRVIAMTLTLVESAINVWQLTFVWDVSDRADGWKK
jgi:hypothetical protein